MAASARFFQVESGDRDSMVAEFRRGPRGVFNFLRRLLAGLARTLDGLAWTEAEVFSKWEVITGWRELIGYGLCLARELAVLRPSHRRLLYHLFEEPSTQSFTPWDGEYSGEHRV